MSDDIPLTPVITRTKISSTPRSVRSIKKRTIFTDKFDESYIEEDDETYIYNETVEEDESEDEEDEEEVDTEVESYVEDKVEDKDEKIDNKGNEKILIIPPGERVGKIKNFLIKHEVLRKLFHSSIGFFTLYLYTIGINQKQLIFPLISIFIILFTNDYIRFHNPGINKFIVQKFWWVIRENEINQYNGILYYLLGLIIVFTFLPKDVSLMSVLLLSWADTSASTFGRQFGKYTFQISKGKSFAGAFASFLTGILSCYLLYGYFIPVYNDKVNEIDDIYWNSTNSKLDLNYFALLCGVIASFSEFVNLFNIDDNFTIPVLSGFLINGLIWISQK